MRLARATNRDPDALMTRRVRWRLAESLIVGTAADRQEAEIAANAGVPIAIFYSAGVRVSRMLSGIAADSVGIQQFSRHAPFYAARRGVTTVSIDASRDTAGYTRPASTAPATGATQKSHS